jgi:3-methyladenine DNA glycosylase AlkD
MTSHKNFIAALATTFENAAHVESAKWQEAYMLNQFSFLGIRTKERRNIQKNIFKQYLLTTQQELIDTIQSLWHKKEREYHYAAMELAYHYRKLWTQDIINTFEYMIRAHAWWDTVDYIAAWLVGTVVKEYPALFATMDIWINDTALWIRRSALLFQLKYKNTTDTKRLLQYCTLTMHEKEFFIRKAIGWALREYSKTNPALVKEFVEAHRSQLSGVTLREAEKYI